ncbi:hypothetical protein G6F43_011202 [Rhizopus delemar]|nr:hypothetical protein G6F43_011202 [Rhizopus delemar]
MCHSTIVQSETRQSLSNLPLALERIRDQQNRSNQERLNQSTTTLVSNQPIIGQEENWRFSIKRAQREIDDSIRNQEESLNDLLRRRGLMDQVLR